MSKQNDLPEEDDSLDRLMQDSYNALTKSFQKTLDRFIVFRDQSRLVELPKGMGQRSKYIDELIKYFEAAEDYEKCKVLFDLKQLVLNDGD